MTKQATPGKTATNLIANTALFTCCSYQQLHFFKCSCCGWLMCYCVGCRQVFTSLRNCAQTVTVATGRAFLCPRCQSEFTDQRFWSLPQTQTTRQDLINAGYDHLLCDEENVADNHCPIVYQDSQSRPRAESLSLGARWRGWLGSLFESFLVSNKLKFGLVLGIIVGVLAPAVFLVVRSSQSNIAYFNSSGRYQANINVDGKEAAIEIILLQHETTLNGQVTVAPKWLVGERPITEQLETGNVTRDMITFRTREVAIGNKYFRKIAFHGTINDRGIMNGQISFNFPELDLRVQNLEFEAYRQQH
ncbi:MAG: hypothetical protein AB1489_03875 [Acidobacteriota bacterium]